MQENKWMRQFLEDEQKSRKELERVIRKISKQKNDCTWDDGGHWTDPLTRRHLLCGSSSCQRRARGGTGAVWRPSLFSVLRCVFIFHPPTSESGSPHLGSPLLNPSSWTSLSGPDQEYGSAKGGPSGWDADQNKAKKTAPWWPSLWSPSSTWNSVEQLLYFFHLPGRRREFWSH